MPFIPRFGTKSKQDGNRKLTFYNIHYELLRHKQDVDRDTEGLIRSYERL